MRGIAREQRLCAHAGEARPREAGRGADSAAGEARVGEGMVRQARGPSRSPASAFHFRASGPIELAIGVGVGPEPAAVSSTDR